MIYDTVDYKDCTITVATDVDDSAAVDLGGRTLVGVIMPAALTGTAISFKTSNTYNDAIANYSPIYDDLGNLYSVPYGASRYVAVDVNKFLGVKNIRILSNGTEASNRTFKLVTRLI